MRKVVAPQREPVRALDRSAGRTWPGWELDGARTTSRTCTDTAPHLGICRSYRDLLSSNGRPVLSDVSNRQNRVLKHARDRRHRCSCRLSFSSPLFGMNFSAGLVVWPKGITATWTFRARNRQACSSRRVAAPPSFRRKGWDEAARAAALPLSAGRPVRDNGRWPTKKRAN